MTKTNKYLLKADELSQLQDAIRHDKRVVVVKRATALRLLHEGHTPAGVANLLGVNLSSIYNWRKRWRDGNLEGLSNRPIAGRPQKATADYWQELEGVLAQNPRDLGYIFSIWTTERLAQHLATITGITLSAERLRVLMLAKGACGGLVIRAADREAVEPEGGEQAQYGPRRHVEQRQLCHHGVGHLVLRSALFNAKRLDDQAGRENADPGGAFLHQPVA